MQGAGNLETNYSTAFGLGVLVLSAGAFITRYNAQSDMKVKTFTDQDFSQSDQTEHKGTFVIKMTT